MKIPECFKLPFLTIIGDCEDTSASGLVLNHLHGVTLRSAAKITNEEFRSGVNMLRIFEQEAIAAVVRDVLLALGAKYQFNKIKSSDLIGSFETDNYENPGAYVGFEIEVSDFAMPGSTIRLSSLEISVNSDVTKRIYIDADGERTEMDVDLKKYKRNYIPLQDIEAERMLRVFYDASDIEVGQSTINQSGSIMWGGDCRCRYTCDGCFIARNISTNDEGLSVFEMSNLPNGIRAQVECIVRPDYLICQYINELAPVIRLKTGIMMMWEHLTSTRQNPLVRNGREAAERLLAKWEGTPDPITGFDQKSEYWKLLSPVIKQMSAQAEKDQNFMCTGIQLAEVHM